MLEVIKAADHEAASGTAARLISESLSRTPGANLLVATGNTPMRAYELLGESRARGEVDASRVTAFQLDEYVGVRADDDRSLFAWMLRSFVEPLGIPTAQVVRLDGCGEDPEWTCREHDRAIARAGGIDLCILGLGPNGHLGFNEPPSGPDAPSRPVDLTADSLASNSVYYSGPVPTRALTTGMAQILASREVILLATGLRKRAILERTLRGPITPDVPASQLRLAIGTVTVVADDEALGDGL